MHFHASRGYRICVLLGMACRLFAQLCGKELVSKKGKNDSRVKASTKADVRSENRLQKSWRHSPRRHVGASACSRACLLRSLFPARADARSHTVPTLCNDEGIMA